MARIKGIICYDGTNYFGYQRQTNRISIQEVLEDTLFLFTKTKIITYASGRTDAKVHARGQVFHFDTDLIINSESWEKGLNSLLPKDIYIKRIAYVSDDFHARFSAIKKEYRYYINLSEYDVFKKNYAIYVYNLDVIKMQEAIKSFIGIHDFKSFSRFVQDKNTIREIYLAEINLIHDLLEIRFVGDGFLKYMVRIMVGTLIEIGLGRRKVSDIDEIFLSQDRKKAGKTAKPEGLFLQEVYYPK